MKKLKLSLVLMATTLAFTSQAEASGGRTFGDIYQECGLGGMIFTHTPVVAAISNIIWDLGTTAVISNISSPATCEGDRARIAKFISKSYDNLEVEIAMGEGKYVDTLVSMSHKDISVIRAEFAKVVASNDYAGLNKANKVEKLYNIVTL